MTTKNHRPTAEHSPADQCPSCGSYCDIFQDLDDKDYCNDCRPASPASTLKEVLEKFNNGESRYDDDLNFKEAADSLAARIGVYAVLDKNLRTLRDLRALQVKTAEENRRLADVVASYKDALELMQSKP